MHIYVYVCTYILVDICSAFSQVMVSAAVIPVQHRATQRATLSLAPVSLDGLTPVFWSQTKTTLRGFLPWCMLWRERSRNKGWGTLLQWPSEMGMELWESPVLTCPLYHTQGGVGFSMGRFMTTQRPTCGRSRTCNLQFFPIPLLSQVTFPPQCFPSWEGPLCCFPNTSSRHQFPAALSSPQQ